MPNAHFTNTGKYIFIIIPHFDENVKGVISVNSKIRSGNKKRENYLGDLIYPPIISNHNLGAQTKNTRAAKTAANFPKGENCYVKTNTI